MNSEKLFSAMMVLKNIIETYVEDVVKVFNCRAKIGYCEVGEQMNHYYAGENENNSVELANEIEFHIDGYIFLSNTTTYCENMYDIQTVWKMILGFVKSIGYQIVDIVPSNGIFTADYGVNFKCRKIPSEDLYEFAQTCGVKDFITMLSENVNSVDSVLENVYVNQDNDKCKYVFEFSGNHLKLWEQFGYQHNEPLAKKLIGKTMQEVVHDIYISNILWRSDSN